MAGKKSSVIGVRLDPRTRYLAGLAAKKQRRSISAFIEWAIEQSFAHVTLREDSLGSDVTLNDEAQKLWDVDDAERFVRLAIHYPELLDHEEQIMWKGLSDSQLLAPAQRRNAKTGALSWVWPVLEDNVFPVLRERWPSIVSVFEADKDGSKIREWVRETKEEVKGGGVYSVILMREAKGEIQDASDDDIPF